MRGIAVGALVLLVGCTTGYGGVRARFVARLAGSDAPVPPTLDALPSCEGGQLVDHVSEVGPYLGVQRFCRSPDGRVVGVVLEGHLEPGDAARGVELWWGASVPEHAFDGPWTVIRGDEHWSGELRDGHFVGTVRGWARGTTFTLTYDDAGRPDGTWTTDLGTVVFDHGNGTFDLTTPARITGTCREGLLDGSVRTVTGDGVTSERGYTLGALDGAYRTLDASGAVIEEGEVRDHHWVWYRGPVSGRCLEDDGGGPGAKLVVERPCTTVVGYVVRADCESATQCSYARETDAGLAPLTPAEERILTLPAVTTGSRCDEPWVAGFFASILPPT